MSKDFTADLAPVIRQLRTVFVEHGFIAPRAIVLGTKFDGPGVQEKLGPPTAFAPKPFARPATWRGEIYGVMLLEPTGHT